MPTTQAARITIISRRASFKPERIPLPCQALQRRACMQAEFVSTVQGFNSTPCAVVCKCGH